MVLIDDDILEKYFHAGRIASRVREKLKRTTREGDYILEICEMAEHTIKELGGKPAFPCNISINEVAAHYTSPPDDIKKIPYGSLVKFDIGVHVDGFIADTATTISFNPEYEDMVKSSEEALSVAIKMIRPGLQTSKLGSTIQKTIEQRGFKPIKNLTGHEVGRYLIHTGKSLPNISHLSINKIEEGSVYAIEPFVTVPKASCKVIDSPEKYIFRISKKKVRKSRLKVIFNYIRKEFRTLPFAERWLKRSKLVYKPVFEDLLSQKSVNSYPVLVESTGECIAQSEKTVYVDHADAIVLT